MGCVISPSKSCGELEMLLGLLGIYVPFYLPLSVACAIGHRYVRSNYSKYGSNLFILSYILLLPFVYYGVSLFLYFN